MNCLHAASLSSSLPAETQRPSIITSKSSKGNVGGGKLGGPTLGGIILKGGDRSTNIVSSTFVSFRRLWEDFVYELNDTWAFSRPYPSLPPQERVSNNPFVASSFNQGSRSGAMQSASLGTAFIIHGYALSMNAVAPQEPIIFFSPSMREFFFNILLESFVTSARIFCVPC